MPSPADRVVDIAGCLLAAGLGGLVLGPTLLSSDALTATAIAVDVTSGVLACIALWWRRRWPVVVALGCLVLGTVSIAATPAGLLALFFVAMDRPTRPALVVAVLWVPAVLVFAVYSPTTTPVSALLTLTPVVLAVTAWGMFTRARRQLLRSWRERAQRAELHQQEHEERARTAERTRIAREMHDVLAHRISQLALHAGGLEMRPDLPAAQVKQAAELMRSTAHQALVELRAVIGVLRVEPGEGKSRPAPQPTLSDIGRLIDDSRRTGARIELKLNVDADAVPGPLGRDVYRIVQEALTNVGKHASGAGTRVTVTGAPGRGLTVCISNTRPAQVRAGPGLPGAGAGLLGLQERVDLAGGTLVHGADRAGGFAVEADLPWPR